MITAHFPPFNKAPEPKLPDEDEHKTDPGEIGN